MKKILLHKIEIYNIEDNKEFKTPFAFMAVSGSFSCKSWTIEDAVSGLLKKFVTNKEHEIWALANGWLPPNEENNGEDDD